MTPCMTSRRQPCGSAGLDDLAALDATGADVHPLRGAADEGLHTLDVRVPTTLGAPVGVRHVHTPAGALATHFTYCCHDGSSSRRSNELVDATSGTNCRHSPKVISGVRCRRRT